MSNFKENFNQPVIPDNQITRASSWRDLFPSKEEEEADFLKSLVKTAKTEFKKNNTLKQYRVEPHPEGDIHIFERTMKGVDSTYQKLISNGNVIITFNYPEESPHIGNVVPNVGNINHEFTVANTVIPSRDFLRKSSYEEFVVATGIELDTFYAYITGKPATVGWEQTMLANNHFPQRIGHRIFPNFVLEAQSKLRQAHPQAFN